MSEKLIGFEPNKRQENILNRIDNLSRGLMEIRIKTMNDRIRLLGNLPISTSDSDRSQAPRDTFLATLEDLMSIAEEDFRNLVEEIQNWPKMFEYLEDLGISQPKKS